MTRVKYRERSMRQRTSVTRVVGGTSNDGRVRCFRQCYRTDGEWETKRLSLYDLQYKYQINLFLFVYILVLRGVHNCWCTGRLILSKVGTYEYQKRSKERMDPLYYTPSVTILRGGIPTPLTPYFSNSLITFRELVIRRLGSQTFVETSTFIQGKERIL